MPDVAPQPEHFKHLAETHRLLPTEPAVFDMARRGIEASMSAWLEPIETGHSDAVPALRALESLTPDHLEGAILGTGPAPLTRLYQICRPYVGNLSLRPGALLEVTTKALDRITDDGYDYKPEGPMAASVWLVHGTRYGEAPYRACYPRKSPIICYWEEKGLILPPQGLSPDGLELMICEISQLNPRRLTEAVNEKLRQKFRYDWRVVASLMISGIDLPGEMSMRLNSAFGRVRKEAIVSLITPASSNHAELERQRRVQQMPCVKTILSMPKDQTAIDPYLGLA